MYLSLSSGATNCQEQSTLAASAVTLTAPSHAFCLRGESLGLQPVDDISATAKERNTEHATIQIAAVSHRVTCDMKLGEVCATCNNTIVPVNTHELNVKDASVKDETYVPQAWRLLLAPTLAVQWQEAEPQQR